MVTKIAIKESDSSHHFDWRLHTILPLCLQNPLSIPRFSLSSLPDILHDLRFGPRTMELSDLIIGTMLDFPDIVLMDTVPLLNVRIASQTNLNDASSGLRDIHPRPTVSCSHSPGLSVNQSVKA